MKPCVHLIATIDIQTMSYTLYYNVCNIYKQWVMFTKHAQAHLYTGVHIEVGHMHITLSVKLCLFSMHAKSVRTTEAN